MVSAIDSFSLYIEFFFLNCVFFKKNILYEAFVIYILVEYSVKKNNMFKLRKGYTLLNYNPEGEWRIATGCSVISFPAPIVSLVMTISFFASLSIMCLVCIIKCLATLKCCFLVLLKAVFSQNISKIIAASFAPKFGTQYNRQKMLAENSVEIKILFFRYLNIRIRAKIVIISNFMLSTFNLGQELGLKMLSVLCFPLWESFNLSTVAQ